MFKRLKDDRASVLIAVIWMLAILAVFTVAVNRQASQELMLGSWMKDKIEASALARAGIARAVFELQQDKFRTFDALNENWASNERAFSNIALGPGTFSVECREAGPEKTNGKNSSPRYGLCDDSGRININKASEIVLTKLLAAASSDISPEKAGHIAQAIIDWRDQDDNPLQNGAESSYYRSLSTPYSARNKNFDSVEELQMVKEIDPKIFKALKPFVTIYGDGVLNFNTASAAALQAVGLSSELAQALMEFRGGADRVLGNKDDEIFQDAGEIVSSVSSSITLGADDHAALENAVAQNLIGTKSNTYRIHSVGRLKKDSHAYEHWVTSVVTREGAVLYWHEGEGGED